MSENLIGIIVVLVILGVAAFYWWRRRMGIMKMVDDVDVETTVPEEEVVETVTEETETVETVTEISEHEVEDAVVEESSESEVYRPKRKAKRNYSGGKRKKGTKKQKE